MDYESPFLINTPGEIIHHLSILFKSKCLLTASFGENDDSFITTIRDVDKKNNLLIFYHGPKEDSTEQLLNSSKITFKTNYLGAEVIFETANLEKIDHLDVPAFCAPIPASLLWMERREFRRVRIPASMPGHCRLTVTKGQDPVNLKLYDISIIGFSMLTDSWDVSNGTALDARFEQCRLVLDEGVEGTVSFEVRSKYVIDPDGPDRMEKIGCKFTRTTSAFESAIQRYTQQIERENRHKQ